MCVFVCLINAHTALVIPSTRMRKFEISEDMEIRAEREEEL